ncbi:MAG: ThiF family adenylyltransferase [Candidatus Nanosyncoccaceae bacterium]|jgi:hypothetical protein
MKNLELDAMIKKSAEETRARWPWREPEVFNYNSTKDQVRMANLLNSKEVRDTFDPIEGIAESEFELLYPELIDKPKEREEYVASVLEQGNEYGEWVFNQGFLIRYPDRNRYRDLRTYRYRNLITKEEQERLNQSQAAVFGLSVGGNIAVALARNGIGRALALGDFDVMDISGLGRTVADIRDVGFSKLDVVAKQVSMLDPFIEQKHFREGFRENIKDELVEFGPDVIFDEIDSMPTSAVIRVFCRELKIPYLTAADVGVRPTLEVRYNWDNKKLYAGMVSDRDAEKMMSGEASDEEQAIIFAKSVGIANMLATPRLIESYSKIGEELAGVSQLGSTALMTAGFSVQACVDILLGNNPREGLTALKPDVALKTKPSILETVRILRSAKLRSKNLT